MKRITFWAVVSFGCLAASLSCYVSGAGPAPVWATLIAAAICEVLAWMEKEDRR